MSPSIANSKPTKGQALLIDAGNTNIVFGLLRGGELVEHFRLATERDRTADEYGALLLPLFGHLGLASMATESVVISSVVPTMDGTLEGLCRRYFGAEPLFVGPELDTGMEISYDNPAEVGADRIVNALAARARYGAPVVVVDFGTATTFDLVDEAGCYAGGIIAPGAEIAAEALFSNASRLYRVGIERPKSLVGQSTAGAMQSGIYYGYVGLVDGILGRLRRQVPGLEAVVATGGQAKLIAADSEFIQTVDPMLTLEGLRYIHERFQG